MKYFLFLFLSFIFLFSCVSKSIRHSASLIITDESAYYSNDDLSIKIDTGSKSKDTEPPQIIYKITPIYPEKALKEHVEGDVEVIMLIMNDGTVKRSKILKSSNTIFNRAALAALMQYKFKPAKDKNKYINAWAKITLQFRLRK